MTTTLLESAEGRRMTVEMISGSISAKVWDRAVIELATLGSAVRYVSALRHVTDWATRPGQYVWENPSEYKGLNQFPINLDLAVFQGLWTTKAQTSLRIRAVWSASLLFVYWKVSYQTLPKEISLFLLVSVAQQAGFSMTPKTDFLT